MPFYRMDGITLSEIVAANLARTSWLPFFNRDGSRPPIPDMIQNVFFFFLLDSSAIFRSVVILGSATRRS